MSYSNSTFTVEITGVPAVVFQTKWHREADEVCRSWAQQHWKQLTTRGRLGGLELRSWCLRWVCMTPLRTLPCSSVEWRWSRLAGPMPSWLTSLSRRSRTMGWVRPSEMLDGLGMAETTPGPLIMVTQFVGFMGAFRNPGALPPMLAGTLGGLLTTWVTFIPCFLWIFLGAPFVESLRGNRALSAALAAITAAVVGVILNLAVWFAIHTWFGELAPIRDFGLNVDVPILASAQPWAIALSFAALVAIFRFKAGMLVTLAGCAMTGVVLHLVGAI